MANRNEDIQNNEYNKVATNKNKKTVATVVEDCLCHGCGTCFTVCKVGAIKICESPSGFLVPIVNEEKCTDCGACLAVCPGSRLRDDFLLPGDENKDPFVGNMLAGYNAQASDEDFLKNGQSGGVVSALVDFLLNKGMCDGAVVTSGIGSDKKVAPLVARSKDDLISAQGSKYCPVSLNTILMSSEYKSLKNPVMVGLPCHYHGLRNRDLYLKKKDADGQNRPLLLGLICVGVYSSHLWDFLSKMAKPVCERADFNGIIYRDKKNYGWPGDVSIYSKKHGRIRVLAKYRHLAKGAYKQPRCYLCFDQMNVLSDVVFGDPWGISKDAHGSTVVLARTERGLKLIKEAIAAGVITAQEINPERIIKGQTVNTRQRPEWKLNMKLWQEPNMTPPDYTQVPGLELEVKPNVSNNFPTRKAKQRKRDLAHSVALYSSVDTQTAHKKAASYLKKVKYKRIAALPKRAAGKIIRILKKLV